MVSGVVAGILIGVVAAVLGFFLPLAQLIPLITIGGILSLVYISFIWRIGLTASERRLFGSYLPEKIRRYSIVR